MAPGADLTAQCPPARMPKLKYRNPLPATETTLFLASRRDSAHQPRDAEELRSVPSTKSSASNCTPSIEKASLTSSSLASTASSVASSDDAQSSKKKKKTGVFRFLSLKEPSKDAFKQYAAAQRRQAAGKGTPPPPPARGTSLSSFTTKKLPDSVPKVNSKWDGVPEIIKKHHPKSSTSNKKNRYSVQSQSSQSSRSSAGTWNPSAASVLVDGTQNPPNSVATPRASVDILDTSHRSRSTSPRLSTTTLPEMSYYFPQPLQDATPDFNTQPEVYHPSVLENTPRPSSSTLDHGSPLEGVLPGLRPDSPASSTGSADTVVRDTADAIFKRLNDQPQKSLWAGAPAVQPLDQGAEVTVPESHNFLFDEQPNSAISMPASPTTIPPIPHYAPTRPVQNFSRPMSLHITTTPPRSMHAPSYRTTPTGSALPTLYETSLASTESLNTAESVNSSDSDETVQHRRHTDSSSIASSHVARSVLSAHWHDSPRERLGLGGRLRMDAQTPWEGQADEPGRVKKYRLSMFGKATPRA